MMTVGLTGQSGAGKTTVCEVFSEAGFKIINADKIARGVMEKGSPCLNETVMIFGEEILNADMTLNRKKLADIVFSDREKLHKLDEISYKYINAEIDFLLDIFSEEGADFAVIDAPTLFEAGADKKCGVIVSVVADENVRLERILERDGISKEDALKRFKSQKSEEFFRKNSDYIIENNGSETLLIEKTKEITEILLKCADKNDG